MLKNLTPVKILAKLVQKAKSASFLLQIWHNDKLDYAE